MSVILNSKPSLEEFVSTFTPLASIPALESEFEIRVNSIAEKLLAYKHSTDATENLAQFLASDESFLGVVLALTNLSQEKFLRILSAERFAEGTFVREWTIKNIQSMLKNDGLFARKIAQLFLEGANSELLQRNVAPFYLHQLSLPADWPSLIQDEAFIQNVVRKKLSGEYTDKKGDAIEKLVDAYVRELQVRYGISYAKGQVRLVRKEVDLAIPYLDDPYIMIMMSYMETTSSSQTSRANEQREMMSEIENDNYRYGTQRVLVNLIDGAGWLARLSDLRKMHATCHYALNLKTLASLEAIVCRYVPSKYFTKAPKPEVIDA